MIENRITGIVGRKGSGKTFRMAKMFCQEHRALLYQPVRVNTEADSCVSHITDDGDLDGVYSTLEQEQFRIVYKVPDTDIMVKGQSLVYTTLEPILRACYEVGNMTLYIDEAHDLLGQSTINPEVRRIIHIARNNRLNIIWVAWSMEVHREIRRATDDYYFYRVIDPMDLDKIKERCGEVTAERVANLKRLRQDGERVISGECLVWSSYNV